MELCNLPNEVIAMVVDFTHTNIDSWSDLSTLRLINRHLNSIVLQYLLGNKVHTAIVQEDIGALESLARSESIEGPGRYFCTALHAAADFGVQKAVKWALERGVDVNKANGKPLHIAVERGHTKVVQILLQGGADVNISKGQYGSVLQTAVFMESREMVSLLLENHASLSHRHSVFGSALDIAACRREGNYAVVDLLLNAGADVNQRDSNFNAPIDRAVICGYIQNVRLLLRHRAIGDRGLQHAIRMRRFDIVHLILRYQPEILEYLTTPEWSPLIYTVKKGDLDMALLLLTAVRPAFRARFIETVEHRRGMTALDCARQRGHVKIAKILDLTIMHKRAARIVYRKNTKSPSKLFVEVESALSE